MLFNEIGDKNNPTIILLHGGGLSDWSLVYIVDLLKSNYHLVTPIIDGHGKNGNENFISIEDSAKKLINYVHSEHNGKVFALGGLSIGAQIVIEAMSINPNISEFSIVESALTFPLKGINLLATASYKLFFNLIKRKWFSKMQSKTLFVPDSMFEQYFTDSLNISKESLVNISQSNSNYQLKDDISKTESKVLIIVGEKELAIMKKSAISIHENIHNSKLFIAQDMNHGELSLNHPEKYVNLVLNFFNEQHD